MHSIPSLAGRRKQSGVSLVEVMIAVVVLAVGMLGIAALQAVTLKNANGSSTRTQAALQIYSMMDIIRADRDNLASYNTNIYVEGDGTGEPGTLAGWLDGLKTTVAPDATGRVICIADTMVCRVGVQWTDANTGGAQAELVDIDITSQL